VIWNKRLGQTGISNENYTKMMAELQNSTADSDKPDLSIDKKGLLRFKNRLVHTRFNRVKINCFRRSA
jgi:hypothetical protein